MSGKLGVGARESKITLHKQAEDCGCRCTIMTERETWTPQNVSYFFFHPVHSVSGETSLFAHSIERTESEGELYLRWESKTSQKRSNVGIKGYMFI